MTVWFALAGTQSTFRSLNWQLFHAIQVDIQEFLTDKAPSAERWFYHFLEKKNHLKRCNTTWRIRNFLASSRTNTEQKPIFRRRSLGETSLSTKMKQFNTPSLTRSLKIRNPRQISTRQSWIRMNCEKTPKKEWINLITVFRHMSITS